MGAKAPKPLVPIDSMEPVARLNCYREAMAQVEGEDSGAFRDILERAFSTPTPEDEYHAAITSLWNIVFILEEILAIPRPFDFNPYEHFCVYSPRLADGVVELRAMLDCSKDVQMRACTTDDMARTIDAARTVARLRRFQLSATSEEMEAVSPANWLRTLGTVLFLHLYGHRYDSPPIKTVVEVYDWVKEVPFFNMANVDCAWRALAQEGLIRRS